MDEDVVFKDHDHALEKQTIYGIIKFPKRYPQIANDLEENLFDSDNCKKILKCIHEILQSSPTLQITASMLVSEIKSTYFDNSLVLIDILKSCAKDYKIEKEGELIYGIQKLKKLRTARALNKVCYKIASTLNDTFDVAEAMKIFNEAHTVINVDQQTVIRGEHSSGIKDLLKDIKKRRDNPDLYKGIKGICDWDELQDGEFGCIALYKKTGKSAALSQMALSNAFKGHNVIFITIESPKRLMDLRFVAHVTKTPFELLRTNQIKDDKLKEIWNYYKERKNSMGNIHVLDIPGKPNSNYISALIKEYSSKEQIAVCYVDYMNIMQTNSGSSSMYDWKIQCQISAELKSCARSTNIPIWTGLQLNDAGDLSFGKNIGDNADLVTTIKKPKNDSLKFVKYIIMYSRSIDPKHSDWIENNFETMTFNTGKKPSHNDLKILEEMFKEKE